MKLKLTLCAVIAAALSACSTSPKTNGAGGKCSTNTDCGSGLVCTADVCVSAAGGGSGGSSAGGTVGGSSASSGSGSTSSAGSGSSSGLGSTSSAGSGSTSSSGSGSSSSAGSSSGSSSGAGSAHVRFINATPAPVGLGPVPLVLDLCIEAAGQTTFTVLRSAVHNNAASAFVEVPATAAKLRVVAAGGDCNAAQPDTDVDFTNTQKLTSVVARGSASAVEQVIVVANVPPSAAHTTNLALVNAVGSTAVAKTAHFASPIPATSLTDDISTGITALVDVAGFGYALDVSLNAAVANEFADVAPAPLSAASDMLIIVALNQGDNTLLVCDGSLATAGSNCKIAAPTLNTQAYLRIANLAAGTPGTYKMCSNVGAGPAVDAGATPTNRATVSAFVSVDSTATVFLVPAAQDCTTGPVYQPTQSWGAHQYATIVLSGTDDTVQAGSYAPSPEANAEQVGVDFYNGFAASNSISVTFPRLGELALSSNVDQLTDSSTVDVSFVAASHLSNEYVRVVGFTSGNNLEGAFVKPVTATTQLSILGGGSGIPVGSYLLTCADDGEIDALGNTLCASTPLTVLDPNADKDRYVRVSNTSAAAVNVCVDSATISVPAGATQGYLFGATVGLANTVAPLCPTDGATLPSDAAVTYVADGTHFTAAQEWDLDGRDSTIAQIAVINGLPSTSLVAQLAAGATVNTSVTLPATAEVTFTDAFSYSALLITVGANQFVYLYPTGNFAPGGGTFSTVVVGPWTGVATDAPTLVWCSEDFTTTDSATSCVHVIGSIAN